MSAPIRNIFERVFQRNHLRYLSYVRGVECADTVRVRFAPSPTGLMHLGGLRTALYNYLFAKSNSGKFLLRIEDTDQTRLVPGAAEKLIHALIWAGLEPDEGPHIGGDYSPYSQSERKHIYQDQVEQLIQNETAYHCFCTQRRLDLMRKDAARRGEMPKYDNKCRHLSRSEVVEKLERRVPSVIRLKLENTEDPWQDLLHGEISHDVAALEGDLILLKSDGFPTYHLANVIDDHLMKITHVLRGVEWQTSTPKHILMYKAFGWTPPQFAHIPLLINSDGSKLSKRQNDIDVEYLKNKGYFPETVLNFISQMGGGFPEQPRGQFSLQDLIDNFNLLNLNAHPSRVELSRLDDINKVQMSKKLLNEESRAQLIEETRQTIEEKFRERLQEDGSAESCILSDDYIGTVLDWVQSRISTISDLVTPEFEYIWFPPGGQVIPELQALHSDCDEILSDTVGRIELLADINDKKQLSKTLKDYSLEIHVKYSSYMKILRLALSGLKEGPSIVEMVAVLGKDGTIRRLQHTMSLLQSSQDQPDRHLEM